jgi:hypothetical protein
MDMVSSRHEIKMNALFIDFPPNFSVHRRDRRER